MRARREPTFDPDLAEGSLEIAELTYQGVESYHAGWAHLHPDDQDEYLDGFSAVESHLAQLRDWQAAGLLEGDHQERLERVLARQAACEPLIRELARARSLGRPPAASASHPMVLDD